MKNKACLLLMGVLFISVLPSCKKKLQTCKLGKYYLSDGNSTPAPNTFSYYDNGELKRIEYATGSRDSLAYNGDTLTILSYDNNGILTADFKGLLNASGAVASGTKNTRDINGNITGTDNLLYEYNSYGNLTKQTTVNASGTSFLVLNYTETNTTTGTLHEGSILRKRYFFYHNTVENKTGLTDLNGTFTPWLGSPSANLLDSLRIIEPATADTTRVMFTHTLDANGYLSKTIRTQLTPVLQSTYHTYQYFDCN